MTTDPTDAAIASAFNLIATYCYNNRPLTADQVSLQSLEPTSHSNDETVRRNSSMTRVYSLVFHLVP